MLEVGEEGGGVMGIDPLAWKIAACFVGIIAASIGLRIGVIVLIVGILKGALK